MSRIARRTLLALALLALALPQPGCGSGDDETTAGTTVTTGGEGAPRILGVTLAPDPPVPGRPLRAAVTARTADGGAPRLEFSWTVKGRPAGDGPAITLPALRRGDSVSVSVVAIDGERRSEPVSASLRVPDARPEIVDLKVERAERDGGLHWVVVPEARDADGDRLTFRYQWLVDGADSGVEGDAFPTASLQRGNRLSVRVVASDGERESNTLESAALEVANSAPEIVSRPKGLDARGEFHYAIRAEDSDGDRAFRYELVEGPDGMTLDAASGQLDWAPRLEQVGEHTVKIAVEDRRGGRSEQEFVLPVVAHEVDDFATPPASPSR